MINGAPVAQTQSSNTTTFPVPIPPQTSQIIHQPVTCVNVGSNGPPSGTMNGTNVNQPPIANAGANQVVSQGSIVALDGTGSFSPKRATRVSYSWVQTPGTPVSLTGSNTARPTFIAPTVMTDTVLGFSLTVRDSTDLVSTHPVTVFVTVKGTNMNQPPVAIATTPSQVASRGSPVTLDGTGSFSPNGDTIVSYSWNQMAGPSVGVLPNTARPVFIAPQVSTSLAFSLTVTDSRGAVSSPSPPVFILVR